MITIQGFAKLCGCNAQTLRYYDRIGLMRPAKVDEWTGYRYYEEEQALTFIRIRSLQQADFSIEEIKTLLEGNDALLQAAFERKIAEQEQKLERIREIQRSYLKDTMDMRNMIRSLTDLIGARANDPALWAEFGLDKEQDTQTRARVTETLTDWLTQCREAGAEMAARMDKSDAQAGKQVLDHMTGNSPDGGTLIMAVDGEERNTGLSPDARTIFERDGWEHVSEWICDLPAPDSSKRSCFVFSVRRDSPVTDPGFPTLMLAVMDEKYHTIHGGMTCRISLSGDGQNHFRLMQEH